MSRKKQDRQVGSVNRSAGDSSGKGAWLGLLFAVLAMSGIIGYRLFSTRSSGTPEIEANSVADVALHPSDVASLNISGDAIALYNQGVERWRNKEYEEAIKLYQHAKVLAPDDLEVRIMLALALDAIKKNEDAVAELKEGLALALPHADPTLLARAHYNMGNFLSKLLKRDEAIEEYRAAIAIEPNYAKAYYALGYLLEQMDLLEEAIDAYSGVLTIQPDDLVAKEALEAVLARREDQSGIGHAPIPMTYEGIQGPPSP